MHFIIDATKVAMTIHDLKRFLQNSIKIEVQENLDQNIS